MKRSNETRPSIPGRHSTVPPCRTSCRSLPSSLHRVREAITTRFGGAFLSREKWLRLAINEAEALAWQTPYPHLVFPLLAEEKVQQLISWFQRQRSVRQSSSVLAFSA